MESSRDQSIIESFVDVADNLVDDFDMVEMLTRLTTRCVTLLGVSAAGVMLASPMGELRLVASSNEAMKVVEVFELQAEEGPCLDAFRTGEPVAYQELQAQGGQWPQFSTVAIEAGFRRVFALPLRLRDQTIGALNLFNREDSPMQDRDVMVARALADLATISVLQHGIATEVQRTNEQLSHALASRIVIEQAKGIVSERCGIDIAEAFSRLRSYARSHNRHLGDVAQATVDGTLMPNPWVRVV